MRAILVLIILILAPEVLAGEGWDNGFGSLDLNGKYEIVFPSGRFVPALEDGRCPETAQIAQGTDQCIESFEDRNALEIKETKGNLEFTIELGLVYGPVVINRAWQKRHKMDGSTKIRIVRIVFLIFQSWIMY